MTTEATGFDTNVKGALVLMQEMASSPHMPAWTNLLFASVLSEESTSYSIHHTLSDIQLLAGLIEEDDQDSLNGWIETDDVPEWFRRVVGTFMAENDLWQKNRIKADLGYAYSAISLMVQPLDEEE